MCFYSIYLQLLHQYGVLISFTIQIGRPLSPSKDALLVNNIYEWPQ